MEKKNKVGRPRFEIDYELLDDLCKIQCTGNEIAGIMRVDYDTLNRALKRDGHNNFTDYFAIASSEGKMSLRRKQFETAMSGSVPLMIWLGKQTLGQTDKSETETTVKTVELVPPDKPA